MSSREATPFENSGAQGTSIVVSCSICLEVISDDGERTKVKLQCGHEFHLDCIGSAFNAKGEMQCPNCRKVENGLWLYANGHRGDVMDDRTLEDDLNDLSRPEMPFSLHWCPFSMLVRLAAFQEGVSIAAAYRNLLANHAIFTEHMPASSAAHSRPHVPYFQPLQSSLASNSADGVNDGPTFHHWSGLSGPNDTNNSHAFPSVELYHNIWDHHSPPFSQTSSRINGADQAQVSSIMLRLLRSDSDGVPGTGASGAYTHPFYLGHGSSSRTGNSVILPPFLGNSLAHAHATGLHSYHQPPNPVAVQAPVLTIVRRSTGQRGYGTIDSAPSSDQPGVYLIPSGSSGQNLPDTENNAGRHFYAWESNRFATYPSAPIGSNSNSSGQIPHVNGGSDSRGSRTMEFWHGQSTEMPSSNGQTESSYQPVNPPRMHPFI